MDQDSINAQLEPTHSRRFLIGVLLIIISLVMGKLVPLIYLVKPSKLSLIINGSVYAFSWLILFVGVYLCGREGLATAERLYYDFQRKSINQVKTHTKKGYNHIKKRTKHSYSHVKTSVNKFAKHKK
ncbi:hypothetical protein HOK51_09770 [Candidatus Woesearchaeota archaeon]|jgi:hypothetical protein|nr:hypothetical protein [Candidatus Woesearchaeota archaeon]MBT6520111.1 hypothetical protein [Candidatus Woesearchaeota archaeon]MBT7366716.1 hypothetical protein [Candidatus Woesearchaeota archaeon]